MADYGDRQSFEDPEDTARIESLKDQEASNQKAEDPEETKKHESRKE